jgi:hypothetical protein
MGDILDFSLLYSARKLSNGEIIPAPYGAPKPCWANGDADQIRSANYEPDLISRIFSCSGGVSFTL